MTRASNGGAFQCCLDGNDHGRRARWISKRNPNQRGLAHIRHQSRTETRNTSSPCVPHTRIHDTHRSLVEKCACQRLRRNIARRI